MKQIWLSLAALTLATLACGADINVPKMKTIPTETMTINEPAPDAKGAFNLTLGMGMGKLNLTAGATGLIEGEVKYNVAEWKPKLSTNSSSLRLEQGDNKENFGILNSGETLVNEWNLKLGATPLNLTINAGAYQSQMDLGGLHLQLLEINDGASDADIDFSSPNLEPMSKFSYNTGASNVEISGLANANFAEMSFTAGAGSHRLDFSGELSRDATVDISAAASSFKIIVPSNANVTINVTGELNNVTSKGSWLKQDNSYVINGGGHSLTINVNVSAGSLELTSKP